MSEVSMWLYPVALAGAIGLFFGVRYGFKWTWGMCLQQMLILVASALGFLAMYVPNPFAFGQTGEAAAAVWAYTAWVLFAIFNFGQRFVLNKVSLDLSLFRVHDARKKMPFLYLLVWGPPASFWNASINAMELYSQGRKAEADALLTQWWQDKRVPTQSRETIVGYLMLGRVLQQDWRGIVDVLNNSGLLSASRSIVPFQMAMRACAEMGEFEKAIAVIDHSNLTANKISVTTLDINFMTFFSLAGAIAHLRHVFSLCSDKQALPEYVRNYWLGRCHAFRGETDEAIAALSESKRSTPAGMQIWHDRIDRQLNWQQEIKAGRQEQRYQIAERSIVEKAYHLYSRWRLASDLVRPAKTRVGVMVVLISVCLAYVATSAEFLCLFKQISVTEAVKIHVQAYALGELNIKQLLLGEWWRAFTYMFLHGNWAHLLLNAGALYLFGRSIENIYGTPRFFLIYFGSGLLSGLAQVILVPQDSAIGASGAILGVFGASIAAMVKLKDVLPASTRKAELRWMLSIAVAQVAFDQLINGVASMTDKSPNGVRIASLAHLGGMRSGFAIGMLLPTRVWTELAVDPLAEKELQTSRKANPHSDSDANPARSS